MKQYKLIEGSLQHRFQQSRAKIQIFGGGFANGKTTAGVLKGLQLARAYPGSNGLVARSTYPKLNDTIRKEFVAWTPDKWIKRKVLSTGSDNMIELNNGSIVNFRYIQQHGKGGESTSSNLLSATYDWIVVDQLEDPEIQEKDFLDLLGRLRGNAQYDGDDPSMPRTGPRWFIGLCNPSRNWIYRKLIKPLKDYEKGIQNPDLLVDNDGKPIIELFEGDTYTNKENLAADYIETLESTYKGQMRERYLLGKWGAFEGLVYPTYDSEVHMVDRDMIVDYFNRQIVEGMIPEIVEAYDHGLASPACYGEGFSDTFGNTFVLDGFHQAELSIEQIAARIKTIRRNSMNQLGFEVDFGRVLADPAIFRRGQGTSKEVGKTVSAMLQDEGILTTRANNGILNGITKVGSYLAIDPRHINPFTGELGAPRLYIANHLHWFDKEITDYYWKKDTAGEYEDKPNDIRDHAMDMIKYMFTHKPKIALFKPRVTLRQKSYMRWGELPDATRNARRHRHAA